MSIAAMSWVWDHYEAEGTELLVMLALANWSTDAGDCFPSYKAIAQKARITERSAKRIIARFAERGDVQIFVKGHAVPERGEKSGKTGYQPRNSYRLLCLPVNRTAKPSGDTRDTTSPSAPGRGSSVASVTASLPESGDTPVTTSNQSGDTGDREEVTLDAREEVTLRAMFEGLSLNDPSVQDPSIDPSVKTAPPAAPTKPLTPQVLLVEEHALLFKQHFGEEARTPSRAQYVMAAQLIERFGIEKARSLLAALFTTSDKWLHESDHQFGTFYKFADKLVVELKNRPLPNKPARTANDVRAQIREANSARVAEGDFDIVGSPAI